MKSTYSILSVFLIGLLFCVNSPAQQNSGTNRVRLIGEPGMSQKWGAGWLALAEPINFKKGDKLRLKIGGTAKTILVRLLPKNEFPDLPVGIVTDLIKVPIDRIVEIELGQPYEGIIQISVHGGSQAWHYNLGGDNGPASLYFVELIPSR